MSVPVTLNGIPYLIPTTGETGWSQEMTNYLVALGSGGVLALQGGAFTLTSDTNFGTNFGLVSKYYKSNTSNIASQGTLRLANSDGIFWRNGANTSDLGLNVIGDALYFNGSLISGGTASPLTTKGDIYTYSTTNARLPIGSNGQVLTVDSSQPTGLAWTTVGGGGGGSVVGFSFTNANGISGVVTNPTTTPNLTLSLGAITPTSVAATGTISASNFTGSVNGTFTGSSSGTNTGDQTITLTGDVTGSGTGTFATTLSIVSIAKGGTGQTTANAGFNALAPSQTGNAGKFLYTDGTNTSWQAAGSGGGGSVTSVSVTANNGITASVATPTTTPNITLGLGNITPTSVAATGTITGSNISGSVSGTNTGDQTISLSGDVTGAGTGAITATLANTTVTAGSYTRANITVDSKGRITAASSAPLQTITLTGDVTGSGTGSFVTTLANSGVTAGTYNNVSVSAKGTVYAGSNVAYLTGNQNITISGDVTGSGATSIALTLASTGVVAGTYASVTVDAKGRVTSGAGLTGDVTTSGAIATLANTTVTPGSYSAANITVDSKGRITSAANGSVPYVYLNSSYSGIGYGVPSSTSGLHNTFYGVNAAKSITTGSSNVVIGESALYSGIAASDMIAIGYQALYSTNATRSVGIGTSALYSDTSGSNTAIGYQAGYYVTGNSNVAVGASALYYQGSGTSNTALGLEAMMGGGNYSSSGNVAVGRAALKYITTGSQNTAVGYLALNGNTGGANNAAIGYQAGYNITTGSNNACLGNLAGTDAVANLTTQSNYVVVGNNSTTNANIKVSWTVTSDVRDKTDIVDIPIGLDFVNKLQPRQFKLKDRETQLPTTGNRYGFIAQEVLELEQEPVIIDNSDVDNLKMKESMIIPALVKAIQELSAELAALKAQVNNT